MILFQFADPILKQHDRFLIVESGPRDRITKAVAPGARTVRRGVGRPAGEGCFATVTHRPIFYTIANRPPQPDLLPVADRIDTVNYSGTARNAPNRA